MRIENLRGLVAELRDSRFQIEAKGKGLLGTPGETVSETFDGVVRPCLPRFFFRGAWRTVGKAMKTRSFRLSVFGL